MYTSSSFRSWLVAALLFCLSPPVVGGEAEDAYAVAVGHYSSGRWKLAEQEFAQFLQQYPDHSNAATAILFEAEAQVQQGNHAAARQGFALFLQREPDHRFANHATFRVAETAHLTGDREAACRELEHFRDRYPEDKLNAYALSYLGEISLSKGELEKADQLYAESLRRFPQGPLAEESRFGLGRALEMQGKLESALETYEVLAAGRGRLADDAQLQIGVSHYNRKRYEEAGTAFEALVTGFPDSDLQADAQYWMGMCRIARREWLGAARILSAAAELHPQHELTGAMLFWLGEAHRHSEDVNRAVACYQRVRQQWPDCKWADDSLRAEVLLALGDGRLDDAASLARNFGSQYPDNPGAAQVRQVLARSLLKQKHYRQAAEILEDLVAGVPELPEDLSAGAIAPVISAKASAALRTNWYYLGLAHLGEGENAKALESLAQVRPLEDEQPLRDGMWVAQATAHIGLEQYAQAIDLLEQYLASQPDGPEAPKCRVQLMVSLARSGCLDEAFRSHAGLSESDKRHPAYLPAVDGVAESAYVAQRYDEAAQLFAVLAAQNATPRVAAKGWSGQGWTHFRRGNSAAAAEAFGQIVQLYPEDVLAPEAALMQGRALEQLKQHKQALVSYATLVDTYADSEHAVSGLFQSARLHERLGDKAAAATSLQRLILEHPDFAQADAARYQLAWLLTDLGRAEQADAQFQGLADHHPESPYWPDAVYRLAERAVRDERFDRAGLLLDQILRADCTPEIRVHTLYLKGQLAGSTRRWQEVVPPMQTLLDEFPDSPLTGPARYWIAESFFRREDCDQASQWFSDLAGQFPDGDDQWMATVHLRQAQIRAQRNEWRAAYDEALTIEEQFPKFRQQYEVDYVIGRCLAMQAKFSAARSRYERVIRSPEGGGTETAAMAQWMIGETYMHQKDYDNALRAFYRVESLFAFPHWQAAALLQAGKCHKMKGEKEEAAKLLAQVLSQHPDSSFAKDASECLKTLDQRGF